MLPGWRDRISLCIALRDHSRARLGLPWAVREGEEVLQQPEVSQRQVRQEQRVVSRQVQQARPEERAV